MAVLFPPTKPDLASGGVGAEHDGTVYTLRGDLEKVGDELGVFTHIDPAESRKAPATMGVHMKKRDTRAQSPLQRLADSLGSHHGPDGVIPEIIRIFDRPIIAGENEHIIPRCGKPCCNEPHTLMRECMRTAEVHVDTPQEFGSALEDYLHATPRKCAHKMAGQACSAFTPCHEGAHQLLPKT
ncbi:hypothetical protein EDC59_101416 [Pseudodesulfovibrio indicus]|uniref:Uncharacterized protein n=1 Tax=Pseudodesulfovibrio indicus TaxID=1716143 RepID=A0AA94PRE8_9BACT|nr:hypothetical protein EDC59_101416 [Pseudodesulfovibrio indicus]